MAFSRYSRTHILNDGRSYGTAQVANLIRRAVENNGIGFTSISLKESQRLDVIAGEHYGDSRLWWVLAAASGIGWALQAPPGTRIVVPDLDSIGFLMS